MSQSFTQGAAVVLKQLTVELQFGFYIIILVKILQCLPELFDNLS